MNKLLKRQIKKYVNKTKELPKEFNKLFLAISDSYDDFDRGRELIERSLEISSEELNELNQALKKNERTLTTLSESTEDCMKIANLKGVITYANNAVCKNHNIKKKDDMIGKEFAAFVPKKDQKKYQDDFTKAKKGEVVHSEYSVPLPDGDNKHILRSFSPIKNEKGVVKAIHIQCRNITSQKKAEEQAKTSETRLFSFIDSDDSFIFLKDKEFKYIIINKANANFFGKKIKDIIGKTDDQLMSKQAAANCQKTDQEALLKKKIIVSTEIVNGRYFETRKFPVHFNEKIIGVGGIVRDVTEVNEAHELVKKSEKELREIYDNMNDAIFVHDPENGKIVDVNKQASTMLGYTTDKIKKMNVEEISSGNTPYDQKNALKKIKLATKGQPQLFEWRGKRKNGEVFWSEVNLKKVIIGGKDRVLAIARDITDRKEYEMELQKRIDQMEFMGRSHIKHHKKLLALEEENKKLRKQLGIED